MYNDVKDIIDSEGFFADIMQEAESIETVIGVVHPRNLNAFQGALSAISRGKVILIGPEKLIRWAAKENDINIDVPNISIFNVDVSLEGITWSLKDKIKNMTDADHAMELACAKAAHDLAINGQINLIMKGSLTSPSFLRGLASKKMMVRGSRPSHVFFRPWYRGVSAFTDAAVNKTYLNGKLRCKIIENAAEAKRVLFPTNGALEVAYLHEKNLSDYEDMYTKEQAAAEIEKLNIEYGFDADYDGVDDDEFLDFAKEFVEESTIPDEEYMNDHIKALHYLNMQDGINVKFDKYDFFIDDRAYDIFCYNDMDQANNVYHLHRINYEIAVQSSSANSVACPSLIMGFNVPVVLTSRKDDVIIRDMSLALALVYRARKNKQGN